MSVQLLRRLFTVDEYHKIVEAGVLTENDRVELIRGEIVQMSPIGFRHAACVDRLTELFIIRLVQLARVRVQNPVTLDDSSEPQPDIALLRRRPDFYQTGHPTPSDIFLLVEVSDTTVNYDREVKITLYAEENIAEVWLVNLTEQCLEVYRQPSVQGYRTVQSFQIGETLTIQALPDVTFTVDELLGE